MFVLGYLNNRRSDAERMYRGGIPVMPGQRSLMKTAKL